MKNHTLPTRAKSTPSSGVGFAESGSREEPEIRTGLGIEHELGEAPKIELKIESRQEWAVAFEGACERGEVETLDRLYQQDYQAWGQNQDEAVKAGFLGACRQGHRPVVDYLTVGGEGKGACYQGIRMHEIGMQGFIWACHYGHVEVVEFLSSSPRLKAAGQEWVNLHESDLMGFNVACTKGHLEVVKFLTTSQVLRAGQGTVVLDRQGRYGLMAACESGQYEVVKFLTISPEVQAAQPRWMNITMIGQDGEFFVHQLFQKACIGGNVEVVKFLTTNPELQAEMKEEKWISVEKDQENGFWQACEMGNLEVVKFLTTSEDLIRAGQGWADVNSAKGREGILSACAEEHWDVVEWCMFGLPKERALKMVGDHDAAMYYPQVQEMERVRQEHSVLSQSPREEGLHEKQEQKDGRKRKEEGEVWKRNHRL